MGAGWGGGGGGGKGFKGKHVLLPSSLTVTEFKHQIFAYNT